MSFLERARNKKLGIVKEDEEKDKEYSTESQSSTSSNSSSTGSSFLDRARSKKAAESLEGWARSSVSLLNEMQSKSSAWSYKDEHRGYSDQISGLLSQASNWRNQYAGNEEAISYINSVVEALSDSKQRSSKIADSYSKYKTQDEYDTAVREYGYWQKWQGKDYLKIRDELAKMDQKSEEYNWLKSYAPSTLTKENIDASMAEVDKEVNSLSKFIDQWDTLDVWVNDYMANPGAASFDLTEEQVQERLAMHRAIIERFGSYDNMRSTLDTKKQELWSLEKHRQYGLLEQNDDFYKVSKDVSKDPTAGFGIQWMDKYYGVGDAVYDYINNINGTQQDMSENGGEGLYYKYSFMEPAEKARYNYLFHKEGEDSAYKYLEYLEPTLNARQQGKVRENAANFANNAGGWASIASIPANLLSIIGLADVAGQSVSNWWKELNTGEYAGPVDFNRPTMTASNISSSIRETRAEYYNQKGTIKLNEDEHPFLSKILNGKGWGDVYQLGMSMADSLAVGGLTKLGVPGATALLGGSAGTQGMLDALERGATDEQAVTMGILNAIFETFFEKVSIDHLVNGDTGKIVTDLLIQGGIEASEEGFTTLANNAADILVMAEKSVREQTILAYMEQGLSREEATKRAIWDEAINLGWDVVGGFLSGGIMGGGSSAINRTGEAIDTFKKNTALGNDIMDTDGAVNSLMMLADDVEGVTTGREQKNLMRQVEKVSAKVDKGSKSNGTARQVAKLYNAVKGSYSMQNHADIVKALTKGENGFSTKEANKIAGALVAMSNGMELTEAQTNLLESVKDNSAVQDIVESINSTESLIGQRNMQLRQLERDVTVNAINKAITKQVTEKEFTPEGVYETSSSKKAIRTDTNEAIDIKGVKDIGKGKLILELSDGQTIDVKNVSFATEADALIYEAVGKLGDNINAESANQLIAQFKGGDAMVFARGIAQAYTYGFYGIDKSELFSKHSLADKLTDEQREFAYNLGREYRPTADKIAKDRAGDKLAKTGKTPGEKGVYFRDKNGNATDIDTYLKQDNRHLNDLQKSGIEMMHKMSEMMGIRFNVFESWTEDGETYYLDENGDVAKGDPNGFYDTVTGEVYIALNAGSDYQGTMVFTIAHEVTHFMRQWSPEHFSKIAEIVFQHGGMKGNVSELIALKKANAKAKGKPISYDVAMEEVVADGMESILKNGKVVQFMADVKQKDHSGWQKLKGWFMKLAKFLRAYIGRQANTVEGRKVSEFSKDLLSQIEQIYAEGAVEGGSYYQEVVDGYKAEQAKFSTANMQGAADGAVVQSEATTEVTSKEQPRTEYEAFPKQVMSLSDGSGTLLHSIEGLTPTKLKGLSGKTINGYTGRDVRAWAMGISGFTQGQIQNVNEFMDTMADFMEEAGVTYKFIGLQDVKDAKLHYTYNSDGSIKSIVLSAMVKNGDYPVNFDLSSICKKREAMSKLVDNLAKRGSLDNGTVKLTPDNIFKINTALKDAGYETACLGCFVESKRYNSLEWAKKFCNKWNAAVKKVNPNATYFGYGNATFNEDSFTLEQAIKIEDAANKYIKSTKTERLANALKKYQAKEEAGLPLVESFSKAARDRLIKSDTISDELKDKYLNSDVSTWNMADVEFLLENGILPGASLSNKQAVTEMVKSGEAYQHLLRPSDLLTDRGISKLEALPNFHGVLYGHYGSGTPKLMQSYTPYNSEIALLPANKNKDQSLEEYLYSIAGVRMQSFSDFQIQNIYDYLQMVADLSARKLPAHAYTKEISFAKLLGMTGIKTNLSVMFDIDPMVDKAHAGLTKLNKLVHRGEYAKVILEDAQGKWVYNIGDYQTQKMFAEAFPDEAKRFLQSIGFADAVKLQTTPGYSANCGIIGVGYSDLGIFAMLDDNRIRYIIPYHASSLPADIKVATNIALGTDYTPYQNNMKVSEITDRNGNKVNWTVKEAYKRLKSGQAVIDELNEKIRTEGWVVKTTKAQTGHGSYGLYENLQETNDPKQTASNFMDWCIGNGTLPLFYQFASHENYYKLIYDYNVYDCVTEEYAPQQAVTNTYPTMVDGQVQPGDVTEGGFDTEYLKGTVDKQMAFMNAYNENRDADLEKLAENMEEGNYSLHSDRDTAPTFYSQMAKVVDGMKQEKFGAASVVSMLRDPKRGVKAEEIKWSGIEAFLDGKKSVTKQELLDFINGSMLQVNEVVLDGSKAANIEVKKGGLLNNKLELYVGGELVDTYTKSRDGRFVGKNDQKSYWTESDIAKSAKLRYKNDFRSGNLQRWSAHKLDGGKNYREIVFTLPNSDYKGGAIGLHWGPNAKGVIAHARVQDFNVNGKKMLFMDEVQSDWHNEGQKKGYLDKDAPNPEEGRAISRKLHDMEREMDKYLQSKSASDLVKPFMKYYDYTEYRAIGRILTATEHDFVRICKSLPESVMKGNTYKTVREYLHEREQMVDEADRIYGETKDKAPDAPFRDTYHEFVLKRLIREAAEKGYDSIGWTPSDIQMERWNPERKSNAEMEVEAKNPDAVAFEEAYKNLYDRKMRKFLEKYGKQWGASVGSTTLNNGTEVWSMDITPAMKESVLTDGQPLYSERVLMGSLFSGGGTLEAGLAYQMLDKEFGVEYDGKIASVYADNHGDHIQVGKVEDFDISKYDDIFYLHASPVCHNFSKAKHGAKELAMDINSAKATAKHLETAMPQVFTVENAPGYRKSESLKIITDKLTELGYKWDVDIYNSADYGSATSRNRVILRAVKDGELPAKPEKQDRTNSWDKVTRDLWETLPKSYLRPSFISAIENTRNLPILDADGKVNVNKPLLIITTTSGHTVTHCWEGDICPTLTTKCGEARLVMPDGNIYAVTPEFMGRIQGLPDDYKYPKEKTRAFTIIGNGIPTHLTKAVVGGVLDSAYEQTHDGQALYQEREEDSVSNRSLLANAFEGIAKPEEQKKVKEYKEKVSLIDAEEKKLRELNEQIKELSFSKGPRDTKKIRDLRDEATMTANRISTYDKQLLRLEASKPLQDVLAREKKRAYDKAVKEGRKALDAYKEKTAKTQRELLNKWKDTRKRAVESHERTVMRNKIRSVVGELNELLLNEDKKRHVPDNLKKAVASALALVNMDTVKAEERAAKYAALIAKETDPDKIDAYTITMENILRKGEKMSQKLKELRDAYEEIQNSDDPDIANGYDPAIAGAIGELSQSIGDTSLADMSIEQLSDVYDMYKMVLTKVRDANKSLIESIKESISNRASRVVGEVKRVGGEHKYRASILDPIRTFFWNNLKPVYAMEHIGSEAMTEAYNQVRKGEDTWAKDVNEARAYYLDKSKKYGYDSWDFDKKYTFKSASELEFELTLEQILSLYAYSKREQAHDHLRLGGFVFDSNIETYTDKGSKLLKYKVNTADAHQITPEILANIIGTLTTDQMGFVDEMQDYLSTVMGAKGNEVTMKMYGVKLFKEKFYFPLKSAKQFMFEQNEVSGEVRIKNSGFTNKVVAKANNPVILNNFMDVWANHVNDMSMYHSFVLPLEDFNRIFNYNSPKQENVPAVSVKGTIQNAYSPAAVNYVKQLITDLNGGARSDPRETFAKSLTARWKKAKVFSSLSVVIQQPSAIGRAFALVDPKYFHPTKDGMNHDELWAELKKYAPVAVIKEMGYFDVNMGRSTLDFIKAKEYSSFKEKAKAFFVDGDYRDEILSKAPALADELSWCAIWNAVKRETLAKNPGLDIKSEPFLMLAGARFTEVITKTQVYDSVLARSANMRSKSGLMSMVTSFMAEPTTSINMLEDALRKRKRGFKGYAGRAFASVAVSVILNNALVALVYGMRDDDEDETFAEKYMQSFVSNMIDDINPLTYLPYLKDMWSLLQGYDIERTDMSLVSDLADGLKGLVQAYSSEDGDVVGAWHDMVGAVANIGGVPLDNIRRDVNGAINFFNTIIEDVNGRATTWGSMGDALESDVRDSLPVVGWLPDETKTDKLYDAIISGDTAYVNRLKGSYKDKDGNFDQSKYSSAVRTALRENDPRIMEAAKAGFNGDPSERARIAKLIIADGFAQDDVVAAINAEINKMKPDDSSGTKAKGFYTAEDFAIEIANGDQASANAIKVDVIQTAQKNGKSAEDAKKSFNSSAKTELKDLYVAGKITKDKAINALVTYCDVNRDDAEDDIAEWDVKKTYGFDYSGRAKAYKNGEVSASQLKSILMTTGGMTAEEADLQIEAYNWEKQGYGDVSSAAVRQYNLFCASSNVPKDVYLHIREFSNNTENDKDANGKTINYSAMKKIMAEINAQYGLTSAQKDAIARSLGWSEKNINKYKPWH